MSGAFSPFNPDRAVAFLLLGFLRPLSNGGISGSSGCALVFWLPAAAFSADTTPARADALLFVGFLRPLSLRILLSLERTHSCLWASCDRFLCGYYFAPSGHTLARGLPAAAFTANTSPKGPLPASLALLLRPAAFKLAPFTARPVFSCHFDLKSLMCFLNISVSKYRKSTSCSYFLFSGQRFVPNLQDKDLFLSSGQRFVPVFLPKIYSCPHAKVLFLTSL